MSLPIYYSEYNNGYNEGRNDKYYGNYYDNNPSSNSYYSNLSYSAVDYDGYNKVYGDLYDDIYGDDITIGSMPSYETEEEDISTILEDPSNQDKLLTAFAFASAVSTPAISVAPSIAVLPFAIAVASSVFCASR